VASEAEDGHLNRDEFLALVAPPCQECGAQVQRLEHTWSLDSEGEWIPNPFVMVCARGHRVALELS
jgi:hypothetical protein